MWSTQATASISYNTIVNAINAVTFDRDDHEALTIQCNVFEDYTAYGIYSDSTDLKNQGSTQAGAGNKFYSGSTNTNHQFRHIGNTITYYNDPSEPMLLNYSASSIDSAMAGSDGCQGTRMLTELPVAEAPVAGSTSTAYTLSAKPNPASNKVIITYTGAENAEKISLRILSLDGRISKEYAAAGVNATEIDCSTFENGFYLYSLVVDGRVVSTSRLVINH